MELMEDKDKHMVTESRNRKMLLEEVETVVVSHLLFIFLLVRKKLCHYSHC